VTVRDVPGAVGVLAELSHLAIGDDVDALVGEVRTAGA
jgi:hypothetical protein